MSSHDIDVGELELDYGEANALAYTGTPQPDPVKDVIGGAIVTKQANFVLWLRRPKRDSYQRQDATEFLINFENWVEHENFLGNPPIIGDEPDNERVWADNGMYFENVEDAPDYGVYQIQLHVRYQKHYKLEEVY